MVNISGAVGYTLLRKNNKIILVLADIHSKLIYCKNGINIDTWFNKIKNNTQLVIEEVPREGASLHELWTESYHTQSLKNFVLEEKYTGKNKLYKNNIELMDIRPYLKAFSWEIYQDKNLSFSNTLNKKLSFSKTSNKELSGNLVDTITFYQYMIHLDIFFMLRKYDKNDFPFIKKVHQYILIFLENKKNKKKKSGIFDHFKVLTNRFLIFKEDFKVYNNKTIKSMVKDKDYEPLIKLNKLYSFIIEWYSILQTFSSDKPSIIHTGLAHSERIVSNLMNFYNLKKINENGINTVDVANNSKSIVSCINLPEEIEKKFKSNSFFDNLSIFNYNILD
jgi:hypothetical protein